MQCTLLGTGTSHGIPVIGCSCSCCVSADPRDNRNRTSALFECDAEDGAESACFVIDTGPEFRIQAIKFGITHLDAVFITHDHADHLHGIDDLRVFSHHKDKTPDCGLPLYANPSVLTNIQIRFPYIFKEIKIGGGKPQLYLRDITEQPVRIGPMTVTAVPLIHGNACTTGYLVSHIASDSRIHSIAYLTDCKNIPDSSFDLLARHGGIIDHLVIDALRTRPHGTHLSFREALDCAVRIGAVHTWLIHICHDMTHEQIIRHVANLCQQEESLHCLTEGGRTVAPSYDGLILKSI